MGYDDSLHKTKAQLHGDNGMMKLKHISNPIKKIVFLLSSILAFQIINKEK